MKRIRFLFLLLALLMAAGATAQETYPAHCRVKTDLNVRAGSGKRYEKIDLLRKGREVVIDHTEGQGRDRWGAIDYGRQWGYVSMRYVEYLAPVQTVNRQEAEDVVRHKGGFMGFLEGLWKVVKWVLWAIAILLVIACWEYIVQLAVYAGMFAGGGALLFILFGGSGGTGAIVGLVVAAFVGMGLLVDRLNLSSLSLGPDSIVRIIALGAYYLISFPIYFLNRLEHFLVSPWRYFFRRNWVRDSSKPSWRVVTEVITVVMYIVTTPLRLANAIIYNIFLHCITGIYDLLLEVLNPSDYDEGDANVWVWIYMFPVRMLKYGIWHVFLLLLESVIWTVVDIFIPALTYYHGTNLNAGIAITSDPNRNGELKSTSNWSTGNFLSSSDPNCSWAGRGVYFAIQRSLALRYSGSNRSGYGGDAVMIACRVSMGRIISYALMPDYYYNQAGGGGNHDEINRFADAHGYTAGEWYNYANVWEYCLFDWQNGYNHLWRIRPVYMLNLRTGLAQHVTGGMQHWLFYDAVLKDLGIK